MRTLPLLLAALPALLPGAAAAFPGTVAAPEGAWPAPSTTYVMLARQGDQTTLTVAPRLTGDLGEVTLVLPLPGPVSVGNDVEIVPPDYLERVEAFAAPRLDEVTCDELVEDRYYVTAPGCTSYEPAPEDAAQASAPAVADLALRGPWTDGEWHLEVVTVDATADGLADWLAARDLTLPPGADALRAEHDAFLVATVAHGAAPEPGAYLEPLQVTWSSPELTLPIRLGGAGVDGVQELVITAITDAAEGAVLIDNYPRAVVADECLVDPDEVGAWYDAQLDDALLTDPLPSWMLEYAGPPGACAPCVGEPLEAFELLDFGYDGDPAEAQISRLRMRYRPEQLDQDLQLVLTPHSDTQTRFVPYQRSLEFAFPVCGSGFPADPGVCEPLRLPEERGCNTGAGPAGGVALLLAFLAVRRRRLAPLVLLVALTAPRVSHADPRVGRAAPRAGKAGPVHLEVSGSTTLLSTDRVRFDALERGGPHLLMPMLGVEARAPLLGLGRGTVGLTGGVRGFVGNATPGEPNMPVGFRFVEPHAGLDLRWGQPSGRVAPTARVGAQVALGVLDSTAWKPRATLGALLHAGGGVYVGDGVRPLILELQASLVPRTDGWGTHFHPAARMPDWIYFPGSANLSLLVGVGFR